MNPKRVWSLMSWTVPLILAGSCLAETALPAPADPPQIPLCMVGDSITWAEEGDYWRAFLLEHIPTLAFVGTHTAMLGYSHAGEGGNGTGQVLARMADIPACPYYSLLIGTNDNNTLDPALVDATAAGTADRIEKIAQGLLAKPGVRRVFLSSVLPCQTDNPLRDQTNARTNVYLRGKLKSFPAGKVVYVDYETPIRATPNWEPMIRLHPTQEGYKLLARVLSEAIEGELGLKEPIRRPQPRPGCGVRVDNLWTGDAAGQTRIPLIAGWYTVSFDVKRVTGDAPTVTLSGVGVAHPLKHVIKVALDSAGKRFSAGFFTEYEGYGYDRSVVGMTVEGCEIDRILLEKTRPSGKASVYGTGQYIDTVSEIRPGELVERR